MAEEGNICLELLNLNFLKRKLKKGITLKWTLSIKTYPNPISWKPKFFIMFLPIKKNKKIACSEKRCCGSLVIFKVDTKNFYIRYKKSLLPQNFSMIF